MSDVSPYCIDIACGLPKPRTDRIHRDSDTLGKERYDDLVNKLHDAGERPIVLRVGSGNNINPFGRSREHVNEVIKENLSRFQSLTLDYWHCEDALSGDAPLPFATEILLPHAEGVAFDFTRAPHARTLRVAGLAYNARKTYSSYPDLERLELAYYPAQVPIFALFPNLAQLSIASLGEFGQFAVDNAGDFLTRGIELKVTFSTADSELFWKLLKSWDTAGTGGATHIEVVAWDFDDTGTLLDGFRLAHTNGGGPLVVTGLQKLGHSKAVGALHNAVWSTGIQEKLTISVPLMRELIQRGGGLDMIRLPTRKLEIVYDAPNGRNANPDISQGLCHGQNFLVFTYVETINVARTAWACPSAMLQWVKKNLPSFLEMCVERGRTHKSWNVIFAGLSEDDVRHIIFEIQNDCNGWIMTAETQEGE